MFERSLHKNEIISLTILLMMLMALVASQAGTASRDTIRTEAPIGATISQQQGQQDDRGMKPTPLKATVTGHLNGRVLTISVDTMAEFGRFWLERQ